MAKNKAYTVWVGRTPGIYNTWTECEAQVKGFPGAKYKGYPTVEEAEEALSRPHEEIIVTTSEKRPLPAVEAIASYEQPANETLDYSADGIDQYGVHKDDVPF